MSRKNPQDYVVLGLNKFNEHCATLGLKELSCYDPDKKAIERAFRKRALKTHPDKGGDPIEFKKINDAYNKLIGHICKLDQQADENELADSILIEVSKGSLPKWTEKLKRVYGYPKSSECKLIIFEGPYKQFKGRSKNTGPITVVLYEDPQDGIPKLHIRSRKYMAWIAEQMLPVHMHVEKGRSIQFDQWRICHVAEFGISAFKTPTPAPQRKTETKPEPKPKRKARDSSVPKPKARRDSEPTPEPDLTKKASESSNDKENKHPEKAEPFSSKTFSDNIKADDFDPTEWEEIPEDSQDPFPKLYNMADQTFCRNGKRYRKKDKSKETSSTSSSSNKFNCGHCGAGFSSMVEYSNHTKICVPDEDFGLTSDIMESYSEHITNKKEENANSKPKSEESKQTVTNEVKSKPSDSIDISKLLTSQTPMPKKKSPNEPSYTCNNCTQGFEKMKEYTSHKSQCVTEMGKETPIKESQSEVKSDNSQEKMKECKTDKSQCCSSTDMMKGVPINESQREAKLDINDDKKVLDNDEDVVMKSLNESESKEKNVSAANPSDTKQNLKEKSDAKDEAKKKEKIQINKSSKISKNGKPPKAPKLKSALGKEVHIEDRRTSDDTEKVKVDLKTVNDLEMEQPHNKIENNTDIQMESLRNDLPTTSKAPEMDGSQAVHSNQDKTSKHFPKNSKPSEKEHSKKIKFAEDELKIHNDDKDLNGKSVAHSSSNSKVESRQKEEGKSSDRAVKVKTSSGVKSKSKLEESVSPTLQSKVENKNKARHVGDQSKIDDTMVIDDINEPMEISFKKEEFNFEGELAKKVYEKSVDALAENPTPQIITEADDNKSKSHCKVIEADSNKTNIGILTLDKHAIELSNNIIANQMQYNEQCDNNTEEPILNMPDHSNKEGGPNILKSSDSDIKCTKKNQNPVVNSITKNLDMVDKNMSSNEKVLNLDKEAIRISNEILILSDDKTESFQPAQSSTHPKSSRVKQFKVAQKPLSEKSGSLDHQALKLSNQTFSDKTRMTDEEMKRTTVHSNVDAQNKMNDQKQSNNIDTKEDIITPATNVSFAQQCFVVNTPVSGHTLPTIEKTKEDVGENNKDKHIHDLRQNNSSLSQHDLILLEEENSTKSHLKQKTPSFENKRPACLGPSRFGTCSVSQSSSTGTSKRVNNISNDDSKQLSDKQTYPYSDNIDKGAVHTVSVESQKSTKDNTDKDDKIQNIDLGKKSVTPKVIKNDDQRNKNESVHFDWKSKDNFVVNAQIQGYDILSQDQLFEESKKVKDFKNNRPAYLGASRFDPDAKPVISNTASLRTYDIESSKPSKHVIITDSNRPSRNATISDFSRHHDSKLPPLSQSSSFAFDSTVQTSPKSHRKAYDRNFNASPIPFLGGKYSVHFAESSVSTFKKSDSPKVSSVYSNCGKLESKLVKAYKPTETTYPSVNTSSTRIAAQSPTRHSIQNYRAKSEGHNKSYVHTFDAPMSSTISSDSSSSDLIKKIQLSKDIHRQNFERAMNFDKSTSKPVVINTRLPRPGNDYAKYTGTLERDKAVRRQEREKIVIDRLLSDRASRATSYH